MGITAFRAVCRTKKKFCWSHPGRMRSVRIFVTDKRGGYDFVIHDKMVAFANGTLCPICKALQICLLV